MGIRVYELAKELGITSKDLIAGLKKLNIAVKGHMSSIDEKAAALVKKSLKAPAKKQDKPKSRTVKKIVLRKKTDKPSVPAKKEQVKRKPSEVAEKKTVKPSPEKTEKPSEKKVQTPKPIAKKKKSITVKFPISLKDLAVKMEITPGVLIKDFMKQGVFVTINQFVTEETAVQLLEKMGVEVELAPSEEEELLKEHTIEEKPENLTARAPVVTFMGHVDHGKTSLLDYIRESKVTEKESGGITQHIGAYEVVLDKGKVSFLDTPGHEAFTAMRARGANATDVVVLVVAADDGIMPQTIEAIDHARAADVPIVIAINKIDKADANIDNVKKQLAEHDLTPEDWGGKTITVGVSAKTGEGVDALLEMLLLEAEMLELKANPHKPASGIVIEAQLSKGRGSVATVLVQQGTLRVGDFVVTDIYCGRIRAMINDKGKRVQEAGPSTPVEILGVAGVPQAGEKFFVVEDEKKAKQVIFEKQQQEREKGLGDVRKVTLEDLYSQIREGQIKELKIIIKTDVQGSIEAIKDSIMNLSTSEVKVNVIHCGTGDVTDADVMLASASNAIIIGFHVKTTPQAASRMKEEKVDVRLYEVIYQITADIHAALEGLLEPYEEEVSLGKAKVLQVFKITKLGCIAGCNVLKGKIIRNAFAKVFREGEEIFKGKISSLKRFKEDAKEVAEGFECGIGISNFSSFNEGDIIEAYQIEKKARRLTK